MSVRTRVAASVAVAFASAAAVGAILVVPGVINSGPNTRENAASAQAPTGALAASATPNGPTPKSCEDGTLPKLDVKRGAIDTAEHYSTVDEAVATLPKEDGGLTPYTEPMGSLENAPVWVSTSSGNFLVESDDDGGWLIWPAVMSGCVKF